MQHTKLIVFDIETIPDPKRRAIEGFPPPAFHQVVAIAFLEADIRQVGGGESYELEEIRAGGDVAYSERDLVRAFFQHLERSKPRLVTYNGRSFDLPVLRYRAMAYGIAAPLFHSVDYGYRYNVDSHCDLMDVLTDFGASQRMRLVDVCAVLGIPAKIDMEGSEVWNAYKAGNLESIRNYCELDVISTYLLYLRYMMHRGSVPPDNFQKCTKNLRDYLTAERTKRTHLGDYLAKWKKMSRGT